MRILTEDGIGIIFPQLPAMMVERDLRAPGIEYSMQEWKVLTSSTVWQSFDYWAPRATSCAIIHGLPSLSSQHRRCK